MKSKSNKIKKVKNDKRYTPFQFFMLTLLIIVVFYSATNFCRSFFQIIKYTEIRFTGVLNPVLGIFYGFPAIIGCTIGNFLVDVMQSIQGAGNMGDMKQNFLYLIPQFLYGFVPYYMWNHIFYKKEIGKYRFGDGKKVFLFSVCMIVASLVVAYGVYFTTLTPSLAPILRDIIFLNDAVACLLFGIPLMMCIYKMHTKREFLKPEKILFVVFFIELAIVIYLATRVSLVIEAESLNKFYMICLTVLAIITLITIPVVNQHKSIIKK